MTIFHHIHQEEIRQNTTVELIASENFVSPDVRRAQGSVLTNKYAEGYPKKRYYGGCEHVDAIEEEAQTLACRLFGATYANVQPHSGSQANQAVFLALLNPGDTILSMSLEAGGHLSHGAKVSLTGKWFNVVSYGVCPHTQRLDYDHVATLAKTHRPKLIIAGGSAYPRAIDFAAFRTIADQVDAHLMVDMAHIAGLVATQHHASPFPHAHVVTSTTQKTLRGPRGGLILTQNETLAKRINKAVFPGLQGGPLMHVIAAKAVAFTEALAPSFTRYIHQVCHNATTMAQTLQDLGYALLTQGTDTHLFLMRLPQHISGHQAETWLDRVHITCNKNMLPQDPRPPLETSGLRLGTAACTTRGFQAQDFTFIAQCMHDVITAPDKDHRTLQKNLTDLCLAYPLKDMKF